MLPNILQKAKSAHEKGRFFRWYVDKRAINATTKINALLTVTCNFISNNNMLCVLRDFATFMLRKTLNQAFQNPHLIITLFVPTAARKVKTFNYFYGLKSICIPLLWMPQQRHRRSTQYCIQIAYLFCALFVEFDNLPNWTGIYL